MNHPHVENLKDLTESQIEQKLYRLNSLYFMTGDQNVRQQMILLMDTYKVELEERRAAARKKQENSGGDEFDNLIKIS